MCYKDIVCKQKPSDKGCTYRNKIIYDLKSYHYEDIRQSEGIQSEKETDEASSLLSLKYQSLSITKFYCKRILLIIQKKQLGMSMLLLII